VYIYKITNKQNTKVYIGITSQSISTRWTWHLYTANNRSPRAIACAIRKYGAESFTIELLETASTVEEAKSGEIRLIALYDSFGSSGYNMTIGGDYIWENQSEEFRKHHRQRTIEGFSNMSAEAKANHAQKISDMWSRMEPEERLERELKRKIGNQQFWSSMSREDRAKIANPTPRTKKYKVTDPEGTVILVQNLAQFCRDRDLSAPGLNACASGRYNRYKGWQCERLENDGTTL
jgi:group I intron endonuclease